ncbi:MAG: hypothetical protein J7M12_02560 [Candidatus Hydrogenedentes bacterium]|nr:hypothetical protein [Candidatus Hydrogenedentota bacterium]
MTTEQIVNRILRLLGDDGSRFPITDVVLPEVNFAQKQVAQTTGCLAQKTNITGWTNANTYPSDYRIYQIDKILIGSTNIIPENFVDDSDSKYQLQGKSIIIDPEPNFTDMVSLYIKCLPADIVDIADPLEIPEQLGNALIYLAVSNLMAVDQNPYSNRYIQMYQGEIANYFPQSNTIFPWSE